MGAYGTGPEMDAFTIAFLIPNLLATIAAGNCAPAMVPVLISAEREGRVARARAFRSTLWLSLSAGFVAAAILYAFAGPLVHVIAPGFDTGRHRSAVELLRVLSLAPVASIAFGYCSAELLSRRKYFLVAAAPAISTAITIAVILSFPRSITALAYGVMAGTLVQAAYVLRLSLRSNSAVGHLRLWTPHTRTIVMTQVPLMGAAVFGAANSSIDQFFAALLPTGNVSALNYANALNSWLVQSVIMAASWVALPEFSEFASSGDSQKLRQRARQYMIALTVVAAPLTVAVLLFGSTGVHVGFERRAFTSHSTALVGHAWSAYALGIVPLAIGMVCVRILNAISGNRALIVVGATMLPLNAALDYILMRMFGIYGIGLSTSLVFCCSAILLLYLVGRRIGNLIDAVTARALLSAVVASAVGGIACLVARRLFGGSNGGLLITAALMMLSIGVLYARAGLLHLFSSRLLPFLDSQRPDEKPTLPV
jgi:putative peptidoglycan lipid II flippase